VHSSDWLNLTGVPNFFATAEISTLEWVHESEIIAVGTLDMNLYVINAVKGEVLK